MEALLNICSKRGILKLMTLVILCSFLLAGCSKEDEGEGPVGTRADLIGTWSQTHAKGYVVMDGNKTNYDNQFEEGVIEWTFHQDGTGSASISHPHLSGFGTFTWIFENGTITVSGYYDTFSGKVLKLTSSSLIFECDLEGREQHEKVTCIRYDF